MTYESIFDLVAEEFGKAGIPHVLVGGFAVNAYGVSRATADLDFLICTDDSPRARGILIKAGYVEREAEKILARMDGRKIGWITVDLLFVDKSTVDGLLAESKKIKLNGREFAVPGIYHLIAMKLHALKNNPKWREAKDFLDVLALMETHHMDPQSDKIKELFLKFGSQEWYDKLLKMLKDK